MWAHPVVHMSTTPGGVSFPAGPPTRCAVGEHPSRTAATHTATACTSVAGRSTARGEKSPVERPDRLGARGDAGVTEVGSTQVGATQSAPLRSGAPKTAVSAPAEAGASWAVAAQST